MEAFALTGYQMYLKDKVFGFAAMQRNTFCNSEKYILQFREIHFAI